MVLRIQNTLQKLSSANLNIFYLYSITSECFAPSMGNFAMEGDVGGAVARDDATVCKALLPELTN